MQNQLVFIFNRQKTKEEKNLKTAENVPADFR